MGIEFIVIIFIITFSLELEKIYFKLLEVSIDDDLINWKKRRNKKLNILFIVLFNMVYVLAYSKIKYNIFVFVLFQILILTSLSDLWMYGVSNRLIYTLLTILILSSILYKINIKNSFLEAIKMFIFMYIIYLISKGGIGGADIRLYTIISYALGFKAAISILIISSWISLVYILYIKILNKNLKNKIPYIPFISLATLFYIIERI